MSSTFPWISAVVDESTHAPRQLLFEPLLLDAEGRVMASVVAS